ncbi:Long chain base biosynthesis protein 1 [Bienertia sinuspersici]
MGQKQQKPRTFTQTQLTARIQNSRSVNHSGADADPPSPTQHRATAAALAPNALESKSLKLVMEAATSMLQVSVDWVTRAFEAPFSGAVVFGVPIGGHLFVEGLLFVVILYLLTQKSYAPPKRPLTKKEIDELCDEWTPEPLIPAMTEEMQREPPKLESAAGPHTIINGKEVVNFASANYLGLVGHEKLLNSCTSALEKYGVGSCGPRGFYGTIDVHLDCESRIANFLGTPDSILYSYGLSTMFSTIPAFCKKGDIIVVDEGVHWGIQNGLYLSRSKIVYFKHNNMRSLESTLEKITNENKRAKQIRRYIVIEGVYQNSGQIAPLDEIIKLKEKYRFRLLMDESNSFGVLGSSGRGVTEYYGVPVEKIDIITAAMGHALAAEGGFCTGNARVIDHQRLSSSGYVFSASLPPYLASAAISAIDVLEENPNLVKKVKENVALLWAGLSDLQGFEIASNPHSPIVFLKLANSINTSKSDMQLLQDIVDKLLEEHSIFVVCSKRSTLDKCPIPIGIRLFVSAGHSESDLNKLCQSLKIVVSSVLKNRC